MAKWLDGSRYTLVRTYALAQATLLDGDPALHQGRAHSSPSELHWLDVPQRIQFKLEVTVHRCLRGNAPQYLVDCCKSSTDAVSRLAIGSTQQVTISSSYHDIVAPTSAVGHLLLQARLPGTRCQTISMIRRLAKALLGDY